ncbi:MAG: PLP-dependent aminotransferase family protein [Salinibacter sp.]|uniref:MocR-like pyridoxine biosynthesis transcription factor PdxR n=1 Tax=Salinibacter sp. TaxID=2065818 RepID=UPI0035D4DAA9
MSTVNEHPTPLVLQCVELDSDAAVPLYRQLYRDLRQAILSSKLLSGMQLPATRSLAEKLDISRNTVLEAYDQLTAEGYLESRVGSGTYVAQELPEELLHVRGQSHLHPSRDQASDGSSGASPLSARGELLTDIELSSFRADAKPRPFRPGLPALDAFPIETWSQLTGRRWRSLPASMLGYRQSTGYPPLRKAISAYLQESRGVHCSPEQVIIVSGTQQAITLTAHVLLDPGDRAWIEDPGYPRAQGAFRWAGAQTVPVPLDEEGLSLHQARSTDGDARLAYVTPSHQYPLGMTMSLSRRLELLDWAERSDAWILEDDYDSEYRYEGRPIAALQGLDDAGRVIYVGSFSKVLFPALRLGYLVVPEALVESFAAAKSLVERCPPLAPQMVVTDFLEEGHFERHLRRMRTLYAERQSILIEALEAETGDQLDVSSDEAGLHLTVFLPNDLDDQAASAALRKREVVAPPLSFYSQRSLDRDGLVLGYAAVDEADIRAGVDQISETLNASVKR